MEKLDKVINYIINSEEYKGCISIKKKMNENSELTNLIEEVKNVQKKYIKSNYDSNVKKELDDIINKLNGIPIYNIYMRNLDKVNEMISYVQDELNDYFDKVVN